MPADQPTATCVIPCYNHGRFVADAVASCLAQADAAVDVVLVDDGSDDGHTPGACDALAGPRVRVVRQQNAGLPAARNAGAALARGEFLVFLDADDWIEPAFVAILARELRDAAHADEHADLSHAYCQERLTDRGAGVVWRVPDWDLPLLLLTNLHPVTTLLRRDRFEAVGGFDRRMDKGYEDWDLWLRLAAIGCRGVRVRQPLFNWRRHAPRTMIDDAADRHDQLYAQLYDNNRQLFERNAEALARRAGSLLRQADAHWVDETGVPLEIQYLRRVRDAYHDSHAVAIERRLSRLANALPAPARRLLAPLNSIGRRRGPNTLVHPAAEADHRPG